MKLQFRVCGVSAAKRIEIPAFWTSGRSGCPRETKAVYGRSVAVRSCARTRY